MADCKTCDGSGLICANCDEPWNDCECDNQEKASCTECEGTGEVDDDEDEDEE